MPEKTNASKYAAYLFRFESDGAQPNGREAKTSHFLSDFSLTNIA